MPSLSSAAGWTDYAKYMPVYVEEMKALGRSIHIHATREGFDVCLAEEQSFNCVGKSQGGLVDFTL